MIKLIGSLADVLQKHGKIISISVLISITLAWSIPSIRDSVLGVVGIGTHSQQMRTADKLTGIEDKLSENIRIIDSIVDTLKELRVFQLQSIITNESLPLELRLSAYDEYTSLGYNSWVHIYYEKMLEPLSKNVMNYRFELIQKGKRNN